MHYPHSNAGQLSCKDPYSTSKSWPKLLHTSSTSRFRTL